MAEVAVSAATVAVGSGPPAAPVAGPPAAIERPSFQIVPRAGLPIVAVVLGLLIAGIAVNELWALLAYLIIAAMIEYAFLRDDLSGGPLVVLTLPLVVFAVHVPVLIGFTVARYGSPSGAVPGAAL